MADIKPIGKALFLREVELRRGIEMMFFAYREAGMATVEGFHQVLEGLLDPQTKRQIDSLGKPSAGSGNR